MEIVTRPFIICAPSGAGKSSILNLLLTEFDYLFGFSISHTTRNPRQGEIDGVHYHFVDRQTFYQFLEKGEFLEHAHVHNNHYATSKSAVNKCAEEKKICILDIDIQGLTQICESKANVDPVCFFINAPNMVELEKRLRGRGTETEENVQLRVKNAYTEIEQAEKCDYIHERFINDDLNVCIDEVLTALSNYYPQVKLAISIQKLHKDQSVDVLSVDKSTPLGNDSARVIASHLAKYRENHHYKVLSLASHQIGDEGFIFLAKSLLEDTKISEVNLCCNPLTDLSVETIVDLLSNNQTIEKLNIANTKITQEGIEKIQNVLKDRKFTFITEKKC